MGAPGSKQPNPALLLQCSASFDWWERWSSSSAGVLAICAWAVAEAAVWPIIPDFLLVPMAAGAGRRFYRPLGGAITGAAAGGITVYLLAFWQPRLALDLLPQLPTITPGKIATARTSLAAHGAWAFLYQPWSGSPFKVWALLAGSSRLNPAIAVPVFVVARGVRMTVFAALAAVLAGWLRGFVRDFFLFLVMLYLGLFFFGWWQVLRS